MGKKSGRRSRKKRAVSLPPPKKLERVSTRPPQKKEKNIRAKIALLFLARSLAVVSTFDRTVKDEIAAWYEGYTIQMKVMPLGPQVTLAKRGDRLTCLGSTDAEADLALMFKHLEAALPVLTIRQGAHEAFAQGRISVAGDISEVMRLTRCLNVTQAYLLFDILARGVMKKIPPIPAGRRFLGRLICVCLAGPYAFYKGLT